jgi:hypothetical protein
MCRDHTARASRAAEERVSRVVSAPGVAYTVNDMLDMGLFHSGGMNGLYPLVDGAKKDSG